MLLHRQLQRPVLLKFSAQAISLYFSMRLQRRIVRKCCGAKRRDRWRRCGVCSCFAAVRRDRSVCVPKTPPRCSRRELSAAANAASAGSVVDSERRRLRRRDRRAPSGCRRCGRVRSRAARAVAPVRRDRLAADAQHAVAIGSELLLVCTGFFAPAAKHLRRAGFAA
jgi:hypothetical protein